MLPIEAKGETMSRIDRPQGALDLLILRTLSRRARYYELTRADCKQLEAETGLWKQLTVAINQVLGEA
jgi:hypothetical protein